MTDAGLLQLHATDDPAPGAPEESCPAPRDNVVERILAVARAQPDRAALDFYGDAWSYGRLRDEIERWAGRFAAAGLAAGETVLVFLPQSPEAIAVFFGVMRCGGVPSFMPLPSPKQDRQRYWASHRQLLELLEPAALITLREQREAMREAAFDRLVPRILCSDEPGPAAAPPPAAPARSRLALLQHSSGTTALKKGVALSHRAVLAQISAYARTLAATPDDVVVSWLPLYHDMGLMACTVMPLVLGQKVVLLDPFRWVAEPTSLLVAITQHRGTLTWLPNFAFELLAKAARFAPGEVDLSSMRAFIDCSEPCKAASFDHFQARFSSAGLRAEALQVCYAMAETVFAVTQTEPSRTVSRLEVDGARLAELGEAHPSPGNGIVLLSGGLALPGMKVRVLDSQGDELPAGRVGEIALESDYLFDGYYRRPELTRRKLRDGRYLSGDLGFVHDGELYVLGRVDDLVIVHGRNYFAHEVEAVVNRVPGLKAGRNVAVGVFNDAMGSEEMVVIAEEDDPLPPQQLVAMRRRVKQAVHEAMGLELRDVRIVARGWLAKTTSGKISRSLNRERYLQEQQAARSVAPN